MGGAFLNRWVVSPQCPYISRGPFPISPFPKESFLLASPTFQSKLSNPDCALPPYFTSQKIIHSSILTKMKAISSLRHAIDPSF